MKQNIAIIMGGYSAEVDISIKSGNVVYTHLDKEKYTPFRVLILLNKWVVLDASMTKNTRSIKMIFLF